MKSVFYFVLSRCAVALGMGLVGCGGTGGNESSNSPAAAAAPISEVLSDDQNVPEGSVVTLEGPNSVSLDRSSTTYSWTLARRPEGSSATRSGPNSPKPTFVADAPGVYSASLEANDEKTQKNATTVVITALPEAQTVWSQPDGTSVAAFDSAPDLVNAWKFSLGLEHPGATGALSQTAGLSGGNAARVDYDLGCGTAIVAPRGTQACGAYVQMVTTFSTPIAVAVGSSPFMTFDVRNPQGVAILLVRLQDSTGQTLQFHPNSRSIEAPAGDAWRRITFPIGSSPNHYGGANDGVLHPPIKSVGIGVGDIAELQPAGWAEFDNVAVVNSANYSFTLDPLATVSAGNFPASYVGRMSVNVSSDDLASVEKAKAVGISVVRRDLTWANIEKSGVYDFSKYAKYAEDLKARGISVLWILAYGHPDHGGSAPITDADRAAYASFAAAAASRFKGQNVVGFEIWNEPNLKSFWPNPDPLAYVKLFNVAATAIRSADQNAKIVVGGTAGVDMNYSISAASAILPNLADAFSIHPYSKPIPENFSNAFFPLKTSISALGMKKPIWDTEWGYSSYGDFDASKYGDGNAAAARNRQGVLVLRRVLTDLGLGIPFINLYNLVDGLSGPLDREANFGLLTYPGDEKPSYAALKNLYSIQSGRTFKGPLLDVPPGVHVLRWDGATDKAFVIWADIVGQSVTISLPTTASIRWWNGSAANAKISGTTQTMALGEADGPLLVTVGS